MDILVSLKSATEFASGWFEKTLKGRSEFSKRVASLSIIVRDLHYELLYSNNLDIGKLEQQINNFEESADPIWIKDSHYNARVGFIKYSRYALTVRGKYGEFRNEIEEYETRRLLTDAKTRLMAIFRRKKVPPAFNPFDSGF